MLRGLAPVLAAGFMAFAAQAQEPNDETPRRGLFLSPMGEPFRGADGAEAWFGRADEDGDGKVTPAEFQADAARFFTQLDANGDEVLDGFELQAYERVHAPEIAGIYYAEGARADRGVGQGRRPRRGAGLFGGGRRDPYAAREGAGRFSHLNIPQPVTGADRDADRRVSLDEWKRVATARFGLLDKAKAGALSWAALPPLPGRPRPD